MITIDQNLLVSLGIELGDATPEFITHVGEQLNERIGAALIELLDDDEAKELTELSQSGSSEDVQKWLEANVEDYRDVIQDEFDILMGELAEGASNNSDSPS